MPGWVGVVLGVAFLFGGKIAIAFLASQGKVDGADEFLKQVYGIVPNVGVVALALSIIRLMIGYTLAVIYEQMRGDSKKYKYSATATVTEKPGLLPKCWQMSRCRPGVRNSCPNYTDHITCWKRRSGCFCDRNLANYLVSMSDRKDFSEADDVQRNVAAVGPGKSALVGHMKNTARRPWLQQRRLCHECPLYLEHQEFKYRTWHWISFPITIVIIIAAFPFFHEGYLKVAGYLDLFMKKLVEMGKMPDNFRPDASTLADSPFEYVVIAMFGLVLASYVVALIDKMFIEWKL
jgi:hypothetical protein